jgi:hypothetical protein
LYVPEEVMLTLTGDGRTNDVCSGNKNAVVLLVWPPLLRFGGVGETTWTAPLVLIIPA